MTTIDILSLSPCERIELAETLYDRAMQEIDALAPRLTAEQLVEIDRRIAQVEAGTAELLPWDAFFTELTQGR